jgi:hypothetical protein
LSGKGTGNEERLTAKRKNPATVSGSGVNGMGYDMSCHHSDDTWHEIHFKDGCEAIRHWCSPFYTDARPFDEWIGSYEIPLEACIAANETVPGNYQQAVERGVADSLSENEFAEARKFLTAAAKSMYGITGSF